MKLGIMQPYFFPYIGYYQLLASVDQFVVYDNIKYTKKGFINRNRILCGDRERTFTLPLQKDSDHKDICERYISKSFSQKDLINKIKSYYQKAPYLKEELPIIEEITSYDETNLFEYIYHSIRLMAAYLDIDVTFVKSSQLNIDHSLKKEHKVLHICKHMKATTYINPIGGKGLYDKNQFMNHDVDLFFLESQEITYNQGNKQFVDRLSIIDVLLFNGKEETKKMLNQFRLH